MLFYYVNIQFYDHLFSQPICNFLLFSKAYIIWTKFFFLIHTELIDKFLYKVSKIKMINLFKVYWAVNNMF